MKITKELIRLGFSESRVVDLGDGLDLLHRSLCKLDSKNLSLVKSLGGVDGLLRIFSRIEDLKDIVLDYRLSD